MGMRPAGRVVMVETSRSPNTVIATVRGMGVAVSTSTCGGTAPLRRRLSRCSTPNRCCSSTTTSPRSANCTVSPSSACVPMTMRDAPLAIDSSTCRRCAWPSWPVSSTGRSSAARSGPRAATMERRCWAASTSVGASRALWPPSSATASMARTATRVLPEPTSPCTRRFMGALCAMSRATSSPTSCWSSVSSNGRAASNSASSEPGSRGVAGLSRSCARRCNSAACSRNAS